MDLSEKLQAGTLDQDERPHPLSSEQKAWVMVFDDGNTLTFLGLYVLVFAARAVRLGVQKKKRNIEVVYGDGRKVAVIPHTTVLEASRIGRIPHASICGGRGRCTTCRVKVDQGAENLSPVGDREARALLRIQAPAGVRLACQAECLRGSVTVLPLLVPDTRSTVARKETADTVGRDVQVAVMFADIRGFTRLSEGRFPYDVVYILNRYFEDMGKAIEAHGGVIDKFLGDGILAYFGLDQDPRDACRNAVLAAWDMADRLERVNGPLASVLKEPLSIGIGIQFGEVILGSLGFQANRHLTIIGDTVNTASRFQGLNKKAASQLILSTEVAARAGFDLTDLPLAKTQVRGKTEISRVYVVKDILKDLDRVIKAESRV